MPARPFGGILRGVTLLLGTALLAELVGIASLMHPLLKHLGGTIVFGGMLVCPGLAVIVGQRMARTDPKRAGLVVDDVRAAVVAGEHLLRQVARGVGVHREVRVRLCRLA